MNTSNLFTMIDLHYRWGAKLDMNYKGLLASHEDKTDAYAKPAYFTAQNVFAIFDVYSIPEANWSRVGDGVVLRQIPV